ncbi:MAG TPA: hypothetical protein GX506_02230 [Firmicutes bacterium]|nr:hypothetical protein [Bacillota bacterium]
MVHNRAAEVWGYFGEESMPSLEKYYNLLNGIFGWWFLLTSEGFLRESVNLRALEFARSHGLLVQGTVHNFVQTRFVREIAHSVLTDPRAKGRAISNIIAAMARYRLDGAHIDLENVDPNDRQALTQFMKDLSEAARRQGLMVTQAVPGKTEENPRHPWSGGFDYRALEPSSDWLVIMAYEEHSATGPPGPLASYNWYRRVKDFAISQLPLDKIMITTGVYGYDWPVAPVETATTVTYADILRITEVYQVPLTFAPDVRECTLAYRAPDTPEGRWHVVWYQCPEAAEWKFRLIRENGVRGTAIWQMGQEDPRVWELVASILLAPLSQS